ncbi:MAG TPA: hypothetical protein VED40_20215 [Azospirillaceae bacterium]|nr:hypothetical protein [Azospirillaceae bacterium]
MKKILPPQVSRAHLTAELPPLLLPHALELYQDMRACLDLRDLSDEELDVYICSENFRPILGHYAAGRTSRPERY